MLSSKNSLRSYFLLAGITLGLLMPFLLDAKDEKDHQLKNGRTDFSRKFQKEWLDRPIVIRQEFVSGAINGYFPSSGTVEKCAKRFYKALDYLPEELIRKSGLKYVTFLRSPSLNGKRVGGIASGNTIFLNVNFSSKTVFHEFFHIFDPCRHQKKWTDLNDRNFIYIGNKYYEAKLTRDEKKQARKSIRKRDIARGFVSDYAMSNETEDRAETFAYMIVEGKNFLRRTKNPAVKAKMEYIMSLFTDRNLLDKAFWEKHFDCRFKLKNRHY